MSYKYYLGPSGAGKTWQMHRDIIDMSIKNPDKRIFVITPDQYTMQTQRDIVLAHPNKAMMNIEIMSFNRLAKYIFNEVGLKKRLVLDDTGKNLILRKIAYEHKDELSFLGSNVDKQGYIHEIKSVISEFMQYGISANDINSLIELSKDKPALQGRLKDLQKLYAEFMNVISDKYMTTEERLSILSRVIPSSDELDNSLIVFDGFTGFTPIQGQVVSSLLEKASQVWLAFTISEEVNEATNNAKNNTESSKATGDSENNSLFALSIKTIKYIDSLATSVGCFKEDTIWINDNKSKRLENNKEIAFLEEHLFRNSEDKYSDKVNNISILTCDTPRDELVRVAISIKKFIQEGNKYMDCAVVTGDLERYAPYVEDIFNSYQIPYFLDSTRKLVLNPFTEYIISGLDVILSDFSYDSIIHFLRSGLTGIRNKDIDILDNYLLARGIRGISKWKKDFVYPAAYMKERIDKKLVKTEKTEKRMAAVNEVRANVVNILDPLIQFNKSKKYEAEKICEAVYQFVVNNNIADKLDRYSDKFEEEKDFVREKEYEQVYEKVLEVLDQIAGLMGEDKIDLDEFVKIMQAGISEIKIGVLPPGMDYVPIGDIERARLNNIKNLYFIGVNDGVIPKNGASGGLISDLDRSFFETNGVELSPSPRQKMSWQKLYLYTNMTKPTEKLYISFSKRDAAGKSIRPSYLIQEMQNMYTELKREYQNSEDIHNNRYREVFTIENCSSLFSDALRDYVTASETDERALSKLVTLYKVMCEKNKPMADLVIDGAFNNYDNSTKRISAELIKALYGAIINNSISRLEEFAGCAYKHFLDYGLSLKEREEAGFGKVDVGNVIHSVLKEFHYKLVENKEDWKTITDEKVAKYVKEILSKELKGYNDNIASESARTAYQMKRLERILVRAVMNMSYQLNKGLFNPKEVEVEFAGELDNKELLATEEKVLIGGQIDRIDTYEDDNKIYVKVVDYKSGDKKLDLIKLYQGQQLQLIVYLDQASKMIKKNNPDKEVIPAAVFYYYVHDPIISSDVDLSEEELDANIKKELKNKGLFLSDTTIVNMLDKELSSDESSNVINASLKEKDEKVVISKGDDIPKDSMRTVINYANYKVSELANSMTSGYILANPEDEKRCSYCAYKDICNKDKAINNEANNNNVNATSDVDASNVIEKMNNVIHKDKQDNQ